MMILWYLLSETCMPGDTSLNIEIKKLIEKLNKELYAIMESFLRNQGRYVPLTSSNYEGIH